MDNRNDILNDIKQSYISKYLQLKLRLSGLSLRGCATRANIPYSTAGSMINKPLGAGINNMTKLCEVLGIRVDILSFMMDYISIPDNKRVNNFVLWKYDQLNTDQIREASRLYLNNNEINLVDAYACLEDGYFNSPSSPYKKRTTVSEFTKKVEDTDLLQDILDTLLKLSNAELELALRLIKAIKS